MNPSWNPPASTLLREVGPRDGFQNETKIIPTDLKARLIRKLAAAGLSHIQAYSFVHPGRVPQMADAEELARLLKDTPSATLSALALNPAGVRRAAKAGVGLVEIGASASPSHSHDNTGMSRDRAFDQLPDMARAAREAGIKVYAGLHCAFGGPGGEEVPPELAANLCEKLLALSPDCLVLADTTGRAGPAEVHALIKRVLDLCGPIPLLLHFHDTRGLGLCNMMAALSLGVSRFDTAFGGLGGCPFIANAAGNVATEDALALLKSLGIGSGVSPSGVAACSLRMERFLARALPGRMHKLLEVPESELLI